LYEGDTAVFSPPAPDPDVIWDGLAMTRPNGSSAHSLAGLVDTTALDWQAAQKAFETEEVLTLQVAGYNRGGLLVTWRSLRGFIPASQLNDFPTYLTDDRRRAELAARVGTPVRVRIIELDRENRRLILSERTANKEVARRESLLDSLAPNQVRQGTVTNLCDFGAFVDLGGIEGLVHISEISWGRVGKPGDVLSIGQRVSVFIISLDKTQGRIALSIKRLLPDPWRTVQDRYQVGQLVKGRITNVVNFGAFACIEEGLEGLIHVSELAEGNFLHPRNVVQEGDVVVARVLSIDGPARRLALSLRQVHHTEMGLDREGIT
jgi:small subunit ribosomal protein S1